MRRFMYVTRELSRTTITIALTAIFVIAVSVHAATTINANIATDGTLSATGLSTLTGGFVSQASSSVNSLTVRDYFQASSTSGFNGLSAFYNGFRADASSTAASTFMTSGIFMASSSAAVTGTTTMAAGAMIGGSGSRVNQLLFGTCSVDIGSMTASSTTYANCTATGVSVTDKVFVTASDLDSTVILRGASTTAANTIQVGAYYPGYGGTISDLDAFTLQWMAVR